LVEKEFGHPRCSHVFIIGCCQDRDGPVWEASDGRPSQTTMKKHMNIDRYAPRPSVSFSDLVAFEDPPGCGISKSTQLDKILEFLSSSRIARKLNGTTTRLQRRALYLALSTLGG
jgi:hypothetical protein